MLGSLSAAVLAFSVGVYADDTEWDSVYNHGSKDRIMTCEDKKFATGICATTFGHDCEHNGVGKGSMLRCTQEAEARSKARYVLGDFGKEIECDLDKNEAAISVCTSGETRDCKCGGEWLDGCAYFDRGFSHMLKCARGLDISKHETKQIAAPFDGDRIECPSGYVMYKMCSSGMFLECEDDEGIKRSHTIGCAKVLNFGDLDREDTGVTKDKLITSAVGFWKPVGSSNSEKSYTVTTGVESIWLRALENHAQGNYGFAHELALGVEASYGTAFMSSELSAGFNQGFSKSVRDEVSSIFTQEEEESINVECGNDDSASFHTLWQWCWETKTATGDIGPIARTREYRCAPGNEFSLKHKPRCIPGLSLNGAASTVCTYDYCDIVAVSDSSSVFHFGRACVDRKLDRVDWGQNPEISHVEYLRGEHLRNGKLVAVGSMTLRRELASSERKDWDGNAVGMWSPQSADSTFQVGDTFRILSESEQPTSTASHLTAFIGMSTVLLAMFVAF